MTLLPQDILVLLKLLLSPCIDWTFQSLAHELSMSLSMVRSSLDRSACARLYDEIRRLPRPEALEEFLIHGFKYAFPPETGQTTRGVPTGFAAPVLAYDFTPIDDTIHVWPHMEGYQQGKALVPLFRSVPDIAQQDHAMYRALALLDAIRLGRAREQALAAQKLKQILFPARTCSL